MYCRGTCHSPWQHPWHLVPVGGGRPAAPPVDSRGALRAQRAPQLSPETEFCFVVEILRYYMHPRHPRGFGITEGDLPRIRPIHTLGGVRCGPPGPWRRGAPLPAPPPPPPPPAPRRGGEGAGRSHQRRRIGIGGRRSMGRHATAHAGGVTGTRRGRPRRARARGAPTGGRAAAAAGRAPRRQRQPRSPRRARAPPRGGRRAAPGGDRPARQAARNRRTATTTADGRALAGDQHQTNGAARLAPASHPQTAPQQRRCR